MKLVIDIGNTLTKIAVFCDDDIVSITTTQGNILERIEDYYLKYPKIESSIISSVSSHDQKINSYLESNGNFIELTHQTKVPFINRYQTPSTLGKDRVAIASAAATIYSGKNTLVIDAGTCITYDFINSSREFLGGSISPGIAMRFKALNKFTEKLPLVDIPDHNSLIGLIGNSTSTSIESGVIWGIRSEIEHVINQYESLYSPLITVISGGDYKYFEKLLKSNIFATPNIVIHGLKKILDFNERN